MKMTKNKRSRLPLAARAVERIQRICTPRTVAIALAAFYLISLLPLLALARYNHASADDYTNGAMCYQAWKNSHSAGSVLGAAINRTAVEWRTWRGCYASAFFSALSPQIFGDGFYRVTTWLILIMFTASVFCLFNTVLVRLLHTDKWTSLSVTALTLFVLVQCTPGGSEVFYWYSGAVNYAFMFGVSLLFYSAMISLLAGSVKRYRAGIAWASVLGFTVGGANQMTALNAAVLVTVLVLYITFRRKWAGQKALLIPILIFYAGFALSIAAPGNFVRAASASGMNPVKAILISLYYGLDLVINEWMTWPMAVVLAVTAVLLWRVIGKTAFRFPAPLLVILFGYCLVSAMMTPPLFAVGSIDSGRAQGAVYEVFIVTAVLCTVYVTGWLRRRYDEAAVSGGVTDRGNAAGDGYGARVSLCLVACLFFLVFGIALTLIPSPRRFTFGSAAADCINGSAAAYDRVMSERALLCGAGEGERVEVPPLQQKPELLFISDITEDAQDWTNRGVARFYGLESVVVKSE